MFAPKLESCLRHGSFNWRKIGVCKKNDSVLLHFQVLLLSSDIYVGNSAVSLLSVTAHLLSHSCESTPTIRTRITALHHGVRSVWLMVYYSVTMYCRH